MTASHMSCSGTAPAPEIPKASAAASVPVAMAAPIVMVVLVTPRPWTTTGPDLPLAGSDPERPTPTSPTAPAVPAADVDVDVVTAPGACDPSTGLIASPGSWPSPSPLPAADCMPAAPDACGTVVPQAARDRARPTKAHAASRLI